MRKSIPILAVACLFLLMAAQAAAASGPWKLSLWQFGVPVTEVQAGSEFEIHGEGFHAVLPVKVCLVDRQCQLADPDRGGEFRLTRTISDAGSFEIWAHQAHDMNITGWRVRAKAPLVVRN